MVGVLALSTIEFRKTYKKRTLPVHFHQANRTLLNDVYGSHWLVQCLTLLMDSSAYAISYHASGDYDMAPAFARNQDWSLMAVQPPAPPGTEAQNLDVYQTASLGPNSSLTQNASPALQEALTQRRSETLDDIHVLNEQPGHVQEDVTRQTDWTPYPNEDDWEQHKPKIMDLYRKMPLKDVMATMKYDHSFNARYESRYTCPLRMSH